MEKVTNRLGFVDEKNKWFSDNYLKYHKLCIHYFIHVFRIDCETANELTQEAFTKALNNLNTFEHEKPFKPWLMAICRNLGIDYFKGIGKKLNASSFSNTFAQDQTDLSEKRILIKQILNSLPERQKEVVEMHYFWELPCEEIGSLLSIPTGTVKSDLYHARKRMLELLKDKV